MKIAIVGYATEGQLSYLHYKKLGHEVTICDANTDINLPQDVQAQLGNEYLEGLEQFDMIIRSAGIPAETILKKNPSVEDKITTQINEFLANSPTRNVIGITGTKGKGTTSTLVTKILEAAGKTVFLGGNIGLAPFSFTDDVAPDDWVVLELSSFQLSDATHSPHIAACLKVVPEHLDWHHTMEAYLEAKSNLFRNQTAEDIAIYFPDSDDSREIAEHSPGIKVPYFSTPGAFVKNEQEVVINNQVVCHVSEIALPGKHNWQNICAAITIVWQITQDIEAIRSVVTTFSGLPHRIELVREVNGVAFYNDSFATGPGATAAAIAAIDQPKVLLIGGYERGLELAEMTDEILEHEDSIRKVLLYGATAKRVAQELEAQGFVNFEHSQSESFEEIIKQAQELAHTGDAVVLSPGFASFDMFKNFEQRGLKFKAIVENL